MKHALFMSAAMAALIPQFGYAGTGTCKIGNTEYNIVGDRCDSIDTTSLLTSTECLNTTCYVLNCNGYCRCAKACSVVDKFEDPCKKLGLTAGAPCGDGSSSGNGLASDFSLCSQYNIVGSSNCTYQNCDGVCKCADKGKCSAILGGDCDNLFCIASAKWNGDVTTTGNETGTTQTRDTISCTCVDTTVYRCAAGYYNTAVTSSEPLLILDDNSKTEITTCAPCPKLGGITGQSPAGVDTHITQCFQPGDTEFSDTTGTFTFSNQCNYTE